MKSKLGPSQGFLGSLEINNYKKSSKPENTFFQELSIFLENTFIYDCDHKSVQDTDTRHAALADLPTPKYMGLCELLC